MPTGTVSNWNLPKPGRRNSEGFGFVKVDDDRSSDKGELFLYADAIKDPKLRSEAKLFGLKNRQRIKFDIEEPLSARKSRLAINVMPLREEEDPARTGVGTEEGAAAAAAAAAALPKGGETAALLPETAALLLETAAHLLETAALRLETAARLLRETARTTAADPPRGGGTTDARRREEPRPPPHGETAETGARHLPLVEERALHAETAQIAGEVVLAVSPVKEDASCAGPV
ncbi:unnamed protein product [Polarella glacialis]|uniref:Uncharacterized protein n=1 Tax=Polarella glacialis TaxID=89957 RepID=A0A813FBX2_POLGL|nr:unnamed protein product [Polarella glacialis]